MRKQTAVYWAPAAKDGFGGRAFEEPVEIGCRWDGVQELFTDGDGNEVLSKGIVYPDRLLAFGGFLKEGTLESSTEDRPTDETDTFGVRGLGKVPNLKNPETLYIVHIR